MKKILFLLMAIIMPMFANADAVEIDGIYYNIISKGGTNFAEVTSHPQKYTGTVNIPESVKYEDVNYSVLSIGKFAFSGCSNLASVTIPNSVTSINESAFNGCSLASIDIPNGVINIGKSAFRFCSGLTSITIPNSVTTIGDNAFECCKGLKSVTIPNSVTRIGSYAFAECSGLISITIPNNLKNIDWDTFDGCSGLTSVTIPNSVTTIGERAFRDCTSLASIDIPNSVITIGYLAFRDCTSLTSVTIGSGIKSIENEVFSNCQKLTDVYCNAVNVPNTNAGAFKDSYIDYATLHVPAKSLNAYKAAEPWKSFGKIEEIEVTGINSTYINNNENDGYIYNLNGIRGDGNSLGQSIYIKNGKKAVIK